MYFNSNEMIDFNQEIYDDTLGDILIIRVYTSVDDVELYTLDKIHKEILKLL